MSAPSSSSSQSANIPAFIASLLGAGLGMVGVLYLTNNLNPAPPTRVTAASPGSPLHRANLRRKSSSADTSSDPVTRVERSPSNVKHHATGESPTPMPSIDMHSSNGLTPLTQTLRDINSRPDGAPVLVVGIAGGSGSGKTTLAQAVYKALGGEDHVTFLSHDSYYKDLSSWTMAQRAQQNFDHPNSLDTWLMVEHLELLRNGGIAEIPNYDFSTHSRTTEVTRIAPKQVVLVEGILIFTEPALADLIDVKIFVDTESDIRLIRRVTRDCQERGRSLEQVLEQYTRTVRPMHIEFVEPSKRAADIIVPVGINSVALSLITDHLRNALAKNTNGVAYMKTPFDESNKRERRVSVKPVVASQGSSGLTPMKKEKLDMSNE